MKILLCGLLIAAVFVSCQGNSDYTPAEDAQDAGREFIRASLDGNYDKAMFYLFKDATNTNVRLLNKWKTDYNKRKQEDKVSFKDANIIAIRIEPVSDSVVNYVYTNTYESKDTTTIKIVKVNGEWLVDLKDIH